VEILGEPVKLVPAEEMIWSKGYVAERERYDGADVLHLVRSRGQRLDWRRLLERYGAHWRVLLSHLVLFGFVYPGERAQVPDWVMDELVRRLQDEQREPAPPEAAKLCQGTLLSREQYLADLKEWGCEDARVVPERFMSQRDIRTWTAAATAGPEVKPGKL
jgi:hypothetical protein